MESQIEEENAGEDPYYEEEIDIPLSGCDSNSTLVIESDPLDLKLEVDEIKTEIVESFDDETSDSEKKYEESDHNPNDLDQQTINNDLVFIFNDLAYQMPSQDTASVHCADVNYRFECPGCNRNYTSLSNFKVFTRSGEGILPLQCTECYQNETSFFVEEKKYNKDKFSRLLQPSECKVCSRQFKTASGLGGHMKVHRRFLDVNDSFKIVKDKCYSNEAKRIKR